MRMNPAVAALVALSPVLLAWSPVQQAQTNPAPSAVKSSALTSSALAFSTGAWSQYHRDNFHQANDQTISTTASVSVGWTSPALSDPVYTEPLVWNGLVYVGTMNNNVYALNQFDGSIQWTVNLGAPQSDGWGCGNINPTGILGTPIIDPASSRIYFVAFLHSAL